MTSRPSVQIGDPFLEKLLIEACLELKEAGLLQGLKDLGGAGLTCAVSEAAAGVRLGADLDLDVVPLREAGMEPFEILTSESQERMLAIVRPEDVDAARAVCRKWGLEASAVATFAEGETLTRAERAARSWPRSRRRAWPTRAPSTTGRRGGPTGWTRCAPTTRPPRRPPPTWRRRSSPSWVRRTWPRSGGRSSSTTRWCRARRWSAPARTRRSSASRERSGPSRCPRTATAATAASTPTWAPSTRSPNRRATSPCAGARPVAITNCLNFGNPERPEVMWQFAESIRGLGDACRALGTPVTGGNVSFYNESGGSGIDPTPVVGMLGILDDYRLLVRSGFPAEGLRDLRAGHDAPRARWERVRGGGAGRGDGRPAGVGPGGGGAAAPAAGRFGPCRRPRLGARLLGRRARGRARRGSRSTAAWASS